MLTAVTMTYFFHCVLATPAENPIGIFIDMIFAISRVASVGLRVSGSHSPGGIMCDIACYLRIDLFVGMRSIHLGICDMRRR